MATSGSVLDLKANLTERLDTHKAPFHAADRDAARAAIARLESVEGAHWAAVWSDAAAPFEARGREREAAGDTAAARDAYFAAYGLLARRTFPDAEPSGEVRELHALGARCIARPAGTSRRRSKSSTLPFAGKPGEGDARDLLRAPAEGGGAVAGGRPHGRDRHVERRPARHQRADPRRRLRVDQRRHAGRRRVAGASDRSMPSGSFCPVFDWIATQPDLDARSRDRRRDVVRRLLGDEARAPVCRSSVRRGQLGRRHRSRSSRRTGSSSRSRAGSYLMDIAPARARTVGGTTYDGVHRAGGRLLARRARACSTGRTRRC